jgi:hypothetical protein
MNRISRLIAVVALPLMVALPLFAQAPSGSLTAWGNNITSTPIPVALPVDASIERVAAGEFNTSQLPLME